MKLPSWVYELAEKVLIESIKYPTVLGNAYQDIVDYYAEILAQHGVHVYIHKVPEEYVEKSLPIEANPGKPRFILLAKTGGGSSILQFNGHYDVVEPGDSWSITEPFKPVKIGDKIYGRGASDMKAGLAVMVAILSYFASREDVNITIEGVFVPDEEIGGMTGTGYLVDQLGSRPNWVVIAEPSGFDNIWIGHKGLVWGYVLVRGIQVHGSTPWLGDNAFEKMIMVASEFRNKYVDRIRERVSKYNYQFPEGAKPTFTLGGKLLSPGSINVVPGFSGFSIDRRLIVEERTVDVIREIEDLLKEISIEKNVNIEFKLVEKMEPAVTDPNSFIVRKTIEASSKVLGVKPNVTVCVGGLDMRYYLYKGIETVTYGPGEPDQPHKIDEYVTTHSIYRFIDIYYELVNEISNSIG
ncbi:MAG: M20 family metallopeptidase [Desulfurococcaceae archaeon]